MVKEFNNINSFLQELTLAPAKTDQFYIAKFEDYDTSNITPVFAYKHNYFEVTISIDYDGEVGIDGRTINPNEFNLIFISPYQSVSWRINDIGKNSKSYILLFKPEFLSNDMYTLNICQSFPFYQLHSKSVYTLTADQKTQIIDLMRKMDQEYKTFDKDSIPILKAYLSLLLYNCKRELKIEQNVFAKADRAMEIALKFEELVIQTKNKRQPIKYFANLLNISPVYLSECVKKATGKTSKEIIDTYTVMEIKSLLKHSSLGMAQIADELGFNELTNFSKYFRKHVGMTPSQYIKT